MQDAQSFFNELGESNLEPVQEKSQLRSQGNPEEVEIGVFDKLAKTLARQAAKLGEDDAKREKLLRVNVVDSLRNFETGQSELGKALSEYKDVYKEQRQWTRVANQIGAAINCSARTIYRMIDEYEASLTSTSETAAKIDRTAMDGPELNKQERRERAARLAIRVFMNNIPENKKLKMLADLLAEEAYQVWGKREQFEIKVKPRRSAFTIDGRKKPSQTQAEGAAA